MLPDLSPIGPPVGTGWEPLKSVESLVDVSRDGDVTRSDEQNERRRHERHDLAEKAMQSVSFSFGHLTHYWWIVVRDMRMKEVTVYKLWPTGYREERGIGDDPIAISWIGGRNFFLSWKKPIIAVAFRRYLRFRKEQVHGTLYIKDIWILDSIFCDKQC